jgi:hypothetical protein
MLQAGRDLQALMESLGLRVLSFLDTTRRLTAFTLITTGVILTRAGTAHRIIHPLIRTQLVQAGILLLGGLPLPFQGLESLFEPHKTLGKEMERAGEILGTAADPE